VARIYNDGIAERVATFETRPRTPEEICAWFDDARPFLVATDPATGAVLGWSRVSQYSDRDVYAGVGDHAVYVDPAARGRGVGRALLEAVAEAAGAAGLHKLTSRVFAGNVVSRAAHRAAGFDEIGIHRRHGRLEGAWIDCVVVERLVGDAAEADADAAA